MPFVKLDCGIIHSSLWAESSDTKICWITLLLLADQTGFVRAAPSAIAREAGIPAEIARQALDLFSSPDNESRSPENQGKRIEKVDGGYRVLNYEKYRERDYTNAERQKRFRERRKAPIITDIINRDGQRCGICGEQISDGALSLANIDHIAPLSRGGSDVPENRQLAHPECNKRKSSASDPLSWRHSSMPCVTKRVTKRRVTQAEAEAEAEADKKEEGDAIGKPSRPQSLNGLMDSEWLERLCNDPTYRGLDVKRSYGKMTNWCKVNGKTPTRRRFINWLNREDKPMQAHGNYPRSWSERQIKEYEQTRSEGA